jgi:hypothetical protein
MEMWENMLLFRVLGPNVCISSSWLIIARLLIIGCSCYTVNAKGGGGGGHFKKEYTN